MIFHVSDRGPFTTMSPRPSPPGSTHEGREWVWAVDEAHLPHYLLPRQCPRVCWATPADGRHARLGSPAARVIAVEHKWAPDLRRAGLNVHRLDPAGFTPIDAIAGYWVSAQDVPVLQVRRVEDCFDALAGYDVEVRLVRSLWPYRDAVVANTSDFSVIRMRNAQPRAAGSG